MKRDQYLDSRLLTWRQPQPIIKRTVRWSNGDIQQCSNEQGSNEQGSFLTYFHIRSGYSGGGSSRCSVTVGGSTDTNARSVPPLTLHSFTRVILSACVWAPSDVTLTLPHWLTLIDSMSVSPAGGGVAVCRLVIVREHSRLLARITSVY